MRGNRYHVPWRNIHASSKESEVVAPNRHEVASRKFFSCIRSGELEPDSEIIQLVSLQNIYDFHKEDESFGVYRKDLFNALHYAVFFNQLKIVQMLLKLRIPINSRTIMKSEISPSTKHPTKNVKNETALHIASRLGFSEIVQFLLDQNEVDINVKNFSNETPSDISKTEEIRKMIESKKISSKEKIEDDKSNKQLNSMDTRIKELEDQWNELKGFLSQSFDFSKYRYRNTTTTTEIEELSRIHQDLETQRQKFHHGVEKLQQELDEKEILKRRGGRSTDDDDNNILYQESFLISVCEEINFFDSRGKWIGSQSLPDHFGTSDGINNFSSSIWNATTTNNSSQKEDKNISAHTTTTRRNVLSPVCQVSPTQIALGDENGRIYVHDLSRREEEYEDIWKSGHFNFTFEAHSSQITSLVSKSNNHLLLSGSYSSLIVLWDVQNKKHVSQFDRIGHTLEINDLIFLDNNLFASCSSDGSLKVVDYYKIQVVFGYHDQQQREPITSIVESTNLLVSGGYDKKIKLYDIRSGNNNNIDSFEFDSKVTSLCSPKNSNVVIIGFENGNISRVDLRRMKSVATEINTVLLWNHSNHHKSRVNRIIETDNNNDSFLSCGDHGFLNICSLETGNIDYKILEKQSCYAVTNFWPEKENRRRRRSVRPKFWIHEGGHDENIRSLDKFRKEKKNQLSRSTNRLLGLFRRRDVQKTEDFCTEFIGSLEQDREFVLDGRIFKLVEVFNRFQMEREKLIEFRVMTNDLTKKLYEGFKKEYLRGLCVHLRPILRKLKDEKSELQKIRKETLGFINHKIQNASKKSFFKRTTVLFLRLIEREKKELKEIRSSFSKFQSSMEEVSKGLTQFSKNVKKLFSDKRVLTVKFERREDMKLKYAKGEFNKLKDRVVGVFGKEITQIHEKLISEYNKVIGSVSPYDGSQVFGYVVKDPRKFVQWKYDEITRTSIGVIEQFQDSKNKTYLGETRDGKPHGNGVIYKFGGARKGLKKVISKKKYHTMEYEGEFKNGVVEGKGIEYHEEKIQYEGQFRSGQREGKGISYEVGGKGKGNLCTKGVWERGKLTSSRSDGAGGDAGDGENSFEFQIIHYEDISDQFVPENVLGSGANGIVYTIIYEGKEAAAKIMNLGMVDRVSRSRIQHYIRRSLRLCASFDHPNVIKVFGMITGHENKIGYVMEKCSHCVSEEMFRKNLDFKEKLLILYETARGMQYLHDRNIMNRDLKWDNVLIRSGLRTEVVLTDFDTAKEDESIWKNSVQNTASSVGTPVYIAPEVLSKKYGLKVDVYSFGIMIHSILFGLQNPYSETEECNCGQQVKNITPYSFPFHIKTCNLRPLIDEKKKLSMRENEWLMDLMKMCYATNPLQRPSFNEIVSQFEKRMNNMVEKRVKIVVKGLEDDPPETYIMLETSYESLTNKILYRWKGSEIVQLYYIKRRDRTISQQQREEKHREEEEEEEEGEVEEVNPTSSSSYGGILGRKLTMSKDGVLTDERGDILIPLKDDEEFVRLMGLSNVSSILVEFEKVPETEKGKLRKELQELVDTHKDKMFEFAKRKKEVLKEVEMEKKELLGDLEYLNKEKIELEEIVRKMEESVTELERKKEAFLEKD